MFIQTVTCLRLLSSDRELKCQNRIVVFPNIVTSPNRCCAKNHYTTIPTLQLHGPFDTRTVCFHFGNAEAKPDRYWVSAPQHYLLSTSATTLQRSDHFLQPINNVSQWSSSLSTSWVCPASPPLYCSLPCDPPASSPALLFSLSDWIVSWQCLLSSDIEGGLISLKHGAPPYLRVSALSSLLTSWLLSAAVSNHTAALLSGGASSSIPLWSLASYLLPSSIPSPNAQHRRNPWSAVLLSEAAALHIRSDVALEIGGVRSLKWRLGRHCLNCSGTSDPLLYERTRAYVRLHKLQQCLFKQWHICGCSPATENWSVKIE